MAKPDPRMTPANGHAAASELRGKVEAQRYVKGTIRSVQQPLVNMSDKPRGERSSQLLYGEAFRVIDERDGYAYGQSLRDGYCGWVLSAALGRQETATHWVASPATHLYPRAQVKAPPEVAVFFGSHLRVTSDAGEFQKVSTGHYVPTAHLQPIRARFSDAVAVADLFLGTPYLWGGCSRWGIDCSGLVQAALVACGVDCPRDTDLQLAALGRDLLEGETPQRGDLVFWQGHVALVADNGMILHANAHHMSAAYEPMDHAVERIRMSDVEGTGKGEVLAIRRLG